MIDILPLEYRLKESLKTETGKPFNKWMTETRSELIQQSIDNCKEMNLEIELHKDELVIDGHKIVRLHDVEDGGDDYYWVYNNWVGLKGMDECDEGAYLASCVGSHIILKGFIPDDEYNRMVYQWNLNNYVKAV